MSEMVERVAKAMWRSEWDRAEANATAANSAAGREVFVHTVPRWENCNLIFLDYARAAIEAMRERLDAPLRLLASELASRSPAGWGGAERINSALQQIDAALSETAPSP